jgi:protein-S-isoprenylcysteine O-methyltransferase Ste14
VDTGIYSVIRHPQYTGGIYAIFLPTLLWYPHWLFGLLGAAGAVLTYFSIRVEDKLLVEKFGDDYMEYRQRVPGMNFVAGIIRLLRRRRNPDHTP